MSRYTSVCFHAETLHDDRVWRLLERALEGMAEKDWRATFLVYPFRAVVAGREARARVREIAARGHEVGQHTHFYAGDATARPWKRTDLSDRNVRDCIRRDYDWLRGCGIEPVGFCAGNFMTTETVYETLAELGFLYDCSARLPWERKNYELPYPFMQGAQVRGVNGSRLVLLPSTEYLTLTQCLHPGRRQRNAPLANGRDSYQLIINHDYDLLIRKVWLGLVWRLRRGPKTVTVQHLAELCLENENNRHQDSNGQAV